MPDINNKEIEDIFSSIDNINQPAPLSTKNETSVIAPVSEIEETSEKSGKKPWIMIATIIAAAILIIISGILFWLKRAPVGNSGTNNDTVLANYQLNAPINVNRITTANVNLNLNKNNNVAITVNANAVLYKDADHDGLSDDAEKDYNTNPKKIDTDDDGLSDREEIKVYLTDPNLPDTDGDGYLDGGEIKNGYDPNGPGKLTDIIK